jgi:hypothetical protein
LRIRYIMVNFNMARVAGRIGHVDATGTGSFVAATRPSWRAPTTAGRPGAAYAPFPRQNPLKW